MLAGWEPWLEFARRTDDALGSKRRRRMHFSACISRDHAAEKSCAARERRESDERASALLFMAQFASDYPAVPRRFSARPTNLKPRGCRKLVFLIPGRRHLFDWLISLGCARETRSQSRRLEMRPQARGHLSINIFRGNRETSIYVFSLLRKSRDCGEQAHCGLVRLWSICLLIAHSSNFHFWFEVDFLWRLNHWSE